MRWREMETAFIYTYISTIFSYFSKASGEKKKSLCAVKHVNGEQVRTDKPGITWILSLTHSLFPSISQDFLPVSCMHSVF